MTYTVVFSPEATDDLDRLFDHLLNRDLYSSSGMYARPNPARAASSTG